MAAVLRKRKIIDTHWGESPAQRPLASFGRVTKAGVQRLGKKPAASSKFVLVQPTKTAVAPATPDSKKRRLEHIPGQALSTPTKPVGPAQQLLKKRQSSGPSKPGEARRIAPLKRTNSAVHGSPTQGARAILEAFVLTPTSTPPNPESDSKSNSTASNSADASSTTPPAASRTVEDLPALHTALLNTLSLHYAHNGTAAPADLRTLAPSIEKLWGRRRVTPEDIRRVIGVQQWNDNGGSAPARDAAAAALPLLSLVDFGRGKICIEHEPAASEVQACHAQPLPTAGLRAAFARNLLLALSDGGELPLAEVTPFVSKTAAVNATGARRLADLKAGGEARDGESSGEGAREGGGNEAGPGSPALNPAVSSVLQVPQQQKPSSRATSLLDRIRAKEAHVAAHPAPSAESAARRAALMRLSDVIPILCSLATRSGATSMNPSASSASAARQGSSLASAELARSLGLSQRSGSAAPPAAPKTVSFTMAALVQRMQQSLRHPISADEARRCVELLADEVLPHWVGVRRVGAMVGVTLKGVVGRAEWVGRLGDLLGHV